MNEHPLQGFEFKFRGYKSFESKYCDIGELSSINIFIGRNNSGKSAAVGAINLLATGASSFVPSRHGNSEKLELIVTQTITAEMVDFSFNKSTSGHPYVGSHHQYGSSFIGKKLVRKFGQDFTARQVEGDEVFPSKDSAKLAAYQAFCAGVSNKAFRFKTIIVPTERKVAPEPRSLTTAIQPDGTGITNAIRAFLYLDSLPRDEISIGLLADLNQVYRGDSEFTEIFCQEDEAGLWEIFLTLKNGKEVRLSESGSSLQSIFIVLCFLRLGHLVQKTDWSKTLFCIEEPENNMHPALLRRLLEHLAHERDLLRFCLVITSHSPICIDWASRRNDAKLIHVSASALGATASTAPTNKSRRAILDDLDIRASDILQANGIVWVEGPTDRIYLRKWIDLYTEGNLKEDVHYSIMFYGGKLLSHLDASGEEGATDELISLMHLNRNIAILMDSDRRPGGSERKPRMQINGTKRRILAECEKADAFAWVTEGREIENYISERLLEALTAEPAIHIDQYESVPDHASIKSRMPDKLSIAHKVAEYSVKSDLETLDLKEKVSKLCENIFKWNAIVPSAIT